MNIQETTKHMFVGSNFHLMVPGKTYTLEHLWMPLNLRNVRPKELFIIDTNEWKVTQRPNKTSKSPTCSRCKDSGWLEPRGPFDDGSYSTMRPCQSCDAYENSNDFKAFRKNCF